MLECNGFTVIREVKALLGKYGAVDFMVVLPGGKLLGIMHDGTQHFISQSSNGMCTRQPACNKLPEMQHSMMKSYAKAVQ